MSPGRCFLAGDPLTAGAGEPTGAIVDVGATTVAIPGLCEAVAARKLKANRKGVTRVNLRWDACEGFVGRARLKGRIVDDCTRLVGRFRSKHSRSGRARPRKFRHRIEAHRSYRGDGIVDAAGGARREPANSATCDASCQWKLVDMVFEQETLTVLPGTDVTLDGTMALLPQGQPDGTLQVTFGAGGRPRSRFLRWGGADHGQHRRCAHPGGAGRG